MTEEYKGYEIVYIGVNAFIGFSGVLAPKQEGLTLQECAHKHINQLIYEKTDIGLDK